ncbi:ABC transporter permease [Ideonella sp. DXS29W]|uniref:ABC transporter permease n=1 Tax=Ideonella lacteola TaxID=2984193 RepID=A0ABU9BS95_9BURK
MRDSQGGGWARVVAREWRHLKRDPWDLGMLTWIPLALFALSWWIFSAGVARDLPIVVIDRDASSVSRSLVRMLDESPGIHVAAQLATEAEAQQLLRERTAFGIVIIPAGLQRDLSGGRSANVQWFYNGQFSAHVGGLGRDVRTVVATLSAGAELTGREKRGASVRQATVAYEPIRVRLVTLFNENANYESFLVLAIIPSLLQAFVALAAITAFGRELKAGSVPAWLEAAGGRWGAAMVGKLVIPAAAFVVLSLLYLAFFTAVRGWAIEGSAGMVVAGLGLLVAAYLGLGTFLIGATLNMRLALSAAAFITAPAFAFSGQGFPLVAMPTAARAWAEALPLTHYLQLQSRHWMAGAPAAYSAGEALVLGLFALVSLAAGAWLLSRRAAHPQAWGRA